MSSDRQPVLAPDYLLPSHLRQFSGAGASIALTPQRQYDPDKKLVFVNGAWTPAPANLVIQSLGGNVATADKLNAEIIPWDRYDPVQNKLRGLMGGWFTMSPPDHPVYVRMPDGSVVSPDRISFKLATP